MPETEKPQKAGVLASTCSVSTVKISRKVSVPVALYRKAIPSNMNTSPTRVVMKALIAASRADFLAYQKPISRYEHKPIISQPTNMVSRLSETTNVYIPKANNPKKAKKREYIGSIEGTTCLCPCSSVTVAPWGGKPGLSWSPLGWPKF